MDVFFLHDGGNRQVDPRTRIRAAGQAKSQKPPRYRQLPTYRGRAVRSLTGARLLYDFGCNAEEGVPISLKSIMAM